MMRREKKWPSFPPRPESRWESISFNIIKSWEPFNLFIPSPRLLIHQFELLLPPEVHFKMWLHFVGKWRGWHLQFSTTMFSGVLLWAASGINPILSPDWKSLALKKTHLYHSLNADKNIGYCYWEQKGCCLTYLPPFFGSHSLQIQHDHWKGRWRRRGQKGSMKKKRKKELFNLSH